MSPNHMAINAMVFVIERLSYFFSIVLMLLDRSNIVEFGLFVNSFLNYIF